MWTFFYSWYQELPVDYIVYHKTHKMTTTVQVLYLEYQLRPHISIYEEILQYYE